MLGAKNGSHINASGASNGHFFFLKRVSVRKDSYTDADFTWLDKAYGATVIENKIHPAMPEGLFCGHHSVFKICSVLELLWETLYL